MKCPQCKKNKPLKSFNKNKAHSTGRQSYCKLCMKIQIAKWKNKNPLHAKAVFAKTFDRQYHSIKGRVCHMLNNARARAKRDGRTFAISREWVKQRLVNNKCEITGLSFTWEKNNGRGHRVNSFAPSIDRVDPSGDYTPTNCRMIVWLLNRAMSVFPKEDFNMIMRTYCEKT